MAPPTGDTDMTLEQAQRLANLNIDFCKKRDTHAAAVAYAIAKEKAQKSGDLKKLL
jgi:hypothetical protein